MTDDIFSATPDEKHKRRGIAGDLTVFRIAGGRRGGGRRPRRGHAARAAAPTSARCSFGVAFTGCTLPGADDPLFTVPEGRMAIGLGIHGEPGIDESGHPRPADGLAGTARQRLLAEVPDGVDAVRGPQSSPILNGLGSLKYEEMFVVYRRIAQLLDRMPASRSSTRMGE